MYDKPKKNFVWNAKQIDWKFWTFYNISVNVDKLKEFVDAKGYAKITMSANKEPDQWGNTHNIIENTYKPAPKLEEKPFDYGQGARPDILDIPF